MARYERNYDFRDLIACASGLNRIARMEYGEENIQVGKSHVRQRTTWDKLHPLHPGEVEPNLADFEGLNRVDDPSDCDVYVPDPEERSQKQTAPRPGTCLFSGTFLTEIVNSRSRRQGR
ncbi:hypothetical protein R1sor_004519 [Riccia sorocarpa]|uniref:Uncharacterized protein n=1 Tax=Riccia sorocarpa TaxID=122646 RepID=A0ABD3HHJ2_9MARC